MDVENSKTGINFQTRQISSDSTTDVYPKACSYILVLLYSREIMEKIMKFADLT